MASPGIFIVEADHGMGVAWGTEGAQECDVLLQFVQGRAAGKGLLDLACISVLGSHAHHLRGMAWVVIGSPATTTSPPSRSSRPGIIEIVVVLPARRRRQDHRNCAEHPHVRHRDTFLPSRDPKQCQAAHNQLPATRGQLSLPAGTFATSWAQMRHLR
jgi:hypothetical protein